MIFVIIGAILIVSFSYLLISNNSKNEISIAELENLYFIREEEKLAYDVYQVLGEKWGIQAFQNISNSEERHQSKVVALLAKYGYEDKSKSLEIGKFNSSDLQSMYNKLVEEGNKSLLDALYVGATIEIVDIKDLENLMLKTDKNDLKQVYENLRMGSENHLSAFKKQISRYETFNENKLIKLNTNNMQSNNKLNADKIVIDVRTKAEFAGGNAPGSINIPLDEIGTRLKELESFKGRNITVVCRSGARAGQALSVLKQAGFANVTNAGPWQNALN